MKKKTKILVCGTTFGQVYLEGIQSHSDYELVGILSTGSKQSLHCSQRYEVPLYTDITQIDVKNIDIVCVVVRSSIVGGKGTTIAKQFLEKGIPVLQEQPVHAEDMLDCLKTARTHKCVYMVNTFYPHIETVNHFINCAKKIKDQSKLIHIDAVCSVQVLYPLLDILNQSIGGLSPFRVNKQTYKNGLFTTVSGEIKEISYDIKIQNQLDANNPDNFFHLLHKIDIYYEGGRLSLSDTHRYCTWYPRVFIPNDEQGNLNLYTDNAFLKLPVSENDYNTNQNISYQKVYEKLWPEAIKSALIEFEKGMLDSKKTLQYLQQLFSLCQLWKEIGQRIGPIEYIEGSKINPLSIGGLIKKER
ncbi:MULTISPECIES: Gfo/Idh/MocA family oxidoreductase [unclassified Mammaliicoccus]|uniref:Gfo/Idh/MocA family oxidoreductase n=1 Tax=unclassified Mammaliicoccus TaxID=2803851 RepID=UPI001EFB48EB|nr:MULTISPECIES: Gfo/Idh/MocA family oxidoreductase [unclassified Mammaliicoccus]